MAKCATGDCETARTGMCPASDESAPFPNASEIISSNPQCLLTKYISRYRWAFVGGLYDGSFPKDIVAGGLSHNMQSFVPHVTRIARLMDLSFTTHPVIQ